MTAKPADQFGVSTVDQYEFGFEIPCEQPEDPKVNGGKPVHAGSRTDLGALVLFLVSNWFVNGETVLIDGGVSPSCFLRRK